jgi:hypothetical protein
MKKDLATYRSYMPPWLAWTGRRTPRPLGALGESGRNKCVENTEESSCASGSPDLSARKPGRRPHRIENVLVYIEGGNYPVLGMPPPPTLSRRRGNSWMPRRMASSGSASTSASRSSGSTPRGEDGEEGAAVGTSQSAQQRRPHHPRGGADKGIVNRAR